MKKTKKSILENIDLTTDSGFKAFLKSCPPALRLMLEGFLPLPEESEIATI